MIVVTAPTAISVIRSSDVLLMAASPLGDRTRPVETSPKNTRTRRGCAGLARRQEYRYQSVRGGGRGVLAIAPAPACRERRGCLCGLHSTGLRSDQEPAREAGGLHIGARPRVVVGWTRRVRYGIAGDGRPDRKHRSGLSVRDLSFVHGQHRPPDSAD